MAAVSRPTHAAALGLALLLGALAGCDRSPTETYVDMTTAAHMGDRDGFLAGFTKDSKQLVESLISLSEAYGLEDANPYTLLVYDSVDGETISDDGETAVLDVRTKSRSKHILMVKTDDGWRIDTKKLKHFWDEEKKRR